MTAREVLDGIEARHTNIRNSTNRSERARYRDDHAALVLAVEAVLDVADRYRYSVMAHEVRAAIENALEGE